MRAAGALAIGILLAEAHWSRAERPQHGISIWLNRSNMCSGLVFSHHLAEKNGAGHFASADPSSADNSLIPDANKEHFSALNSPGACKTLQ